MKRAALLVVPAALGCALVAGVAGDRPTPGLELRTASPSPQSPIDRRPFAPRLRVEQRPVVPGRPGEVVIDLTQQEGEAALARATITGPNGFHLGLHDDGPLAEVEAVVAGAGGERVLRGHLTEATGKDGCGDEAATPLAALLGDGSPRAARLGLVAGVQTGGGSPVLTLCPADGAGSLRRLTIRLARAETPAGIRETLWHGRFVPAGPPARDAESRAVVPVPSFLTLESTSGPRVRPGARVSVRGYLLQVDPQAGRSVRVMALSDSGEATILGRARTGANGSYSLEVEAPPRPGAFELVARVQSLERPCPRTAGQACSPTVVSGVSSPRLLLTVG